MGKADKAKVQRKGPNQKPTAHIKLDKSLGVVYAKLKVNNRGRSLGRYDVLSPTGLLDISLSVMGKLKLRELEGLMIANKDMREPFRKQGRPPKGT